MKCSICEKESKEGKIYTLTPEAAEIAKQRLHVKYPQQFWVCNDCLANPLKQFAQTLFEMSCPFDK